MPVRMPVVVFAAKAPSASSTPVQSVPAQNWYFWAAVPVVQAVPQALVVLVQPVAAAQTSVVQSTPSSHDLVTPAVQTPVWQVDAGV